MRKTREFKPAEIKYIRDFICEKSGYRLKKCLLIQAFVRRSYTVQCGGENNEILEFVGDRVLDYYVVKIIAERYGALNHDCEFTIRTRENRLTVAKSELVNNKALAAIIDDWGLAEYLVVGKCDVDNNVDQQEKVKADLFEAILGAIAIESKWDAKVLEKAVEKMLGLHEKLQETTQSEHHFAQCNLENAVTILKELAEHEEVTMPSYDFGGPEDLGYDENGNPIWTCRCSCIGRTGYARLVYATSKTLAKKAAAYLILCEHFELQNAYGYNGKYQVWEFVDDKLMPSHLSNCYSKSI